MVETGRDEEDVVVPLAHTEGGLTASMQRGAKAAAESGGFRTYVLADRITRASCFVCKSAGEALTLARWLEGEVPAMRALLEAADFPELSRYARLREAKTHVVGPMCHVLWRWTTGDAVGPNMMTRNAYALNMGYVMQRAPVKPERAILEANMGGDKKPSFEFFQSGHGKTVIAEATLTEEAVRRVLRTTVDDLLELAWAGTHGAVASGMQSVAFTPASAIAAVFAATGQDLGMVGTSSMAHGVGRRVEGGLNVSIRFPGLEVGTVGGGTTLPYARDWLALMGCARPRQGLPVRAARGGGGARARDVGLGRDGHGRLGELLPGPPRARRPALMLALLFQYDARDDAEFEQVYGPKGEWAQFFRTGAGYIGTELLKDAETPGRYLVIDRWESREAYNAFVEANRDEYMRRVDETAFHYERELRLGTFENVW